MKGERCRIMMSEHLIDSIRRNTKNAKNAKNAKTNSADYKDMTD